MITNKQDKTIKKQVNKVNHERFSRTSKQNHKKLVTFQTSK